MAASSLLALIDDIAGVLDDVAALTKAAAAKSAGVVGDDLALNAHQAAGVAADRELPVVWAVAKGSLKNKLILVPAAMALSALAPWAVTPLLMLGGLFLCYEGFEKVAHKLLHAEAEDEAERERLLKAVADPAVDLVALEREKIRGAVRTDFILSAEIVAIALGAVREAPPATRFAALAAVGLIVTAGVYGLVAAIVKLDDAGLHLSRKRGSARAAGRLILRAAPWLMKGLSLLGTAAMFLVGGGILIHGLSVPHGPLPALAAGVLAGGAAVGLQKAAAALNRKG